MSNSEKLAEKVHKLRSFDFLAAAAKAITRNRLKCVPHYALIKVKKITLTRLSILTKQLVETINIGSFHESGFTLCLPGSKHLSKEKQEKSMSLEVYGQKQKIVGHGSPTCPIITISIWNS
ncbi:hypothetical protein AVEN_110024-1 [Araneus ventricosus]|uniref:Uncharacterized protein n=1 Tax=Araneus ventricosus TaxID=182803 RepID=A0A4Y2H244_ARAVE|nr:hypothetical protein AVEN_110024-1 [Araneus ventricosus]